MVNKVVEPPDWQRFDPALELVWLGAGSRSHIVTLNNHDGAGDVIVRFVQSDDVSRHGPESNMPMSTVSSRSTPRRKPLAPLAIKTRRCKTVANDDREMKIQSDKLEDSNLFTCGFGSTCEKLSASDPVSDENRSVPDQESQDVSSCGLGQTDAISEVFACSSLHKENEEKSMLQTNEQYREVMTTFLKSSRYRIIPSLPEEYGPIRHEVFPGEATSCHNSEATTDFVSNVTFAKLADTILTSQASKKTVEPMDRIAALLDSKGVGRGTGTTREIQESSNLRLFLDDYSEANYWPLLDGLYFNKCLYKLVLLRRCKSDGSRVRTQQEIDCLFRVLNRMKSTLTELHLWNFAPDDQPMLARGLAYNSSLEYIQLYLETGTLSPSFARCMATMPKLVSLEVEVSSNFPVSKLLESNSLAVLSITCVDNPFIFDDNEIVDLSAQLQTNTALSVLNLEPCVSADTGLPAMLDALKSSNRTLDTFQFSCAASDFQQGDLALECVLDVLRTNTKLRVLWNNLYESWTVSARMRQNVFEVLKGNKTIQQFHIFPETADYWYKKNHILEHNMVCCS